MSSKPSMSSGPRVMSRTAGKKRGAQPRTPASQSGAKRWPVFVAGLLCGLLLAGGVYLLQILPTAMELRERELATGAAQDATNSGEKNTGDDAAGKKPVTFDFYNMLPSQKVVAPAPGRDTPVTPATIPVPPAAPPVAVAPGAPAVPETSVAPASSPAPAPVVTTAVTTPAAPAASPAQSTPEKPAATTGARYSLQAGSFATRAEADRRRGELLLSGHDVNVQQATTEKGDTRFRVIVGPFGDEGAMQKAKQQLAAMKIDSMPVRIK